MGYYGLNHLGWLYRLESGGRDLLPGLLADPAALASFEEGRLFPQPFLAELGALPNEYLYYYYQRDSAAAAMRAMAAHARRVHPPPAGRAVSAARRSRTQTRTGCGTLPAAPARKATSPRHGPTASSATRPTSPAAATNASPWP